MAKLQAVALTLECVPSSSLVEDFVLMGWFEEAVWIFEDHKEAAQVFVNFAQNMDVHYHSEL
ncbi:hypothetical protein G9A89_014423 [Geosiphon pyriformis]|nr:hypothetical protein G9A89_014423 [Geosiphon pyriformis]